jgi:tRNA A-37 threonylcarbamoyl transferase component Bud32
MRTNEANLLGWITAAAGVGLLGAGILLRSSAHDPLVDLTQPARQAHERIERTLSSQARELEPKVVEAARVPELVAALNMGADRTTFQDLLETEDWWGSFRRHFPLSGVVTAGGPLGLLAPGPVDLEGGNWLRGMGDRALFSAVLPARGRAFLVAMAKVVLPKHEGDGPVAILGTLLDHAALARISESTGDCVGLADESKLLESAGTGEPGRVLAALAGRKDDAPLVLEDGRVGTTWPIGAGLRILAAFRQPPTLAPAPGKGPIGLMVAGAVVLLVGLGLGLSRRRTPQARFSKQHSNPREAATGRSGATATLRAAKPATGPPARTAMALALNPEKSDWQGSPSSASASAAPVDPNQMGRYHLIERIGEGGMAEIFFAVAHGAEGFVRHFVVKRMHREISQNRIAVDQFIDEAKLQARLVHSNIVPVFDFGKVGEEYFLALEYIHGRDVHQVVQKHVEQFGRPLDPPVAFYILHEVMVALAFAHAQTEKDGTPMDVVHRDVAPGNVLVSYQGEVKLTDFGIAKAERRVSRTEVGMVKGNASFMSPEQARGEIVDQRSDIFSAGLVLYHCLTAQPFYRGETPMGNLLGAAIGPGTSQFGLIDQLPLPAAQILRRALAIDPDQRYPTATAFGQDLAPHMGTRAEAANLMDVLFPAGQRRDLR